TEAGIRSAEKAPERRVDRDVIEHDVDADADHDEAHQDFAGAARRPARPFELLAAGEARSRLRHGPSLQQPGSRPGFAWQIPALPQMPMPTLSDQVSTKTLEKCWRIANPLTGRK